MKIHYLISLLMLPIFIGAGCASQSQSTHPLEASPSDQSMGVMFDLQTKCANEGRKLFYSDPAFQFFRAHYGNSKTLWDPPEYHFNAKLQSCLMAWTVTDNVGGVGFKMGGVIDVLANKTILKSGDFGNPLNYDQYLEQKIQLMSQ